MATSVSIDEFKRQAPRLIERAARGERIVITRRGKPPVQLQRVEEEAQPVETPRTKRWLREKKAYEALLPRLRRKYKGRYVAVMGGEVVDADPDHNALFERLWQSDMDTAFFIGPVGFEDPVVEIPHLEVIE